MNCELEQNNTKKKERKERIKCTLRQTRIGGTTRQQSKEEKIRKK
jgi:hypothetical protein